MAKLTLSPREFIQKSFSPCVAVIGSPLVDEICQKNNLSFIELIEPFSTLDKEVSFRDPSGSTVTVRNLRIVLSDVNQKPPEAAVARRLLNESVTSDLDSLETITIKSGNISVEIPSKVPWFEKWRDTFFKVQFPSDHEFTKHYIACMLVITSKEDNPMDSLSNMVQQLQHMLSMSPPKMIPKWFSSSVLRYYVLLHDSSTGDERKAEKVFEEMKLTYNANCCHMLRINSSVQKITDIALLNYWKNVREDDNSEDPFPDVHTQQSANEGAKCLFNSDVLLHPLSPELESQQMFNTEDDQSSSTNDCNRIPTRGIHLTNDDIANISSLVSSFIVTALIPFVETQMQYLNEVVQNKKKSFFSATKRWLGSKPSSSVTVPNAHYYHPDSPELQMRRLGDLCFMFGAYSSAFNVYHSVKGDFRNDGAWLHFAGALEMLALSAFLIGQDVKKAQEYTDESVVSYINVCRMPQFATRLTLCATECLKNLNLYGEAAGKLLLMTCEDSDLRSALLLEEASYCFVKSRKLFMPRKYAFHLVLAGHRFSKAGQKKHSLRCYRQAYQVYENKNWSLAEDHIHFTIGKLASALKQKEFTSVEFAKLFEKPSAQLPAQQASFLKEYLSSLAEYQKTSSNPLPFLQIPRVDHSTIKVALNTCAKSGEKTGFILANKILSEDELENRRWWKLEELIISSCNNGVLPLLFRPTLYTFSDRTNNSTKPTCVVGERIRTSVDLVNILNIPFTLKNIKLLWTHSSETENPTVDKNDFVEDEILDSLSLDPDSKHNVSLYITPRASGEVNITGITYSAHLAPSFEGAESLGITGYVTLNPRGMKIISIKDKRGEDSEYAADYRLRLVAVEDAPRLKVYIKDLPTEMLCGEVKEVTVLLENVGKLPVNRVLFASSENGLFDVPSCKGGSDVFALPCGLIEPGASKEVTIFVRACDISGRISIDLLFYYDSEKSSQKHGTKYRLIYHTMHVLIHESLFSSVSAARSLIISSSDQDSSEDSVNFKVHLENRNQVYESHKVTIDLEQISLLSSSWKLVGLISPFESSARNISLLQEQTAFIVLKVNRKADAVRSDLNLVPISRRGGDSSSEPFDGLVDSIMKKVVNAEADCISPNVDYSFYKKAVAINAVLILYWKAIRNKNGECVTIRGQHHVPILKLGSKYVSNVDTLSQVERFPSPSTLSVSFARTHAINELVSVRMKHTPYVAHSFFSSRICCVPVELFVRNCCDDSVEMKLDGTYRAHNHLSKINESSMFLWLGLVLHTFCIPQHGCIRIPLTLCVGSAGTYDLSTQISVSARKTNFNDVFVSQTSVSHSLLSVTDSIS